MRKKDCYQNYENFDWSQQKIKKRTKVVGCRKHDKKTVFDYIRSLLF